MPIVTQDIVATTLERYGSTLVKNLPKKSPALNWIAKQGRSTDGGFSGRVYRQPLEYGLNTNVQFYSGAEQFRVDKTTAFSYADFYMRQLVGTVVIEGIEEAMNDGKEAQINYLKAKISNLERSLQLIVSQSVHFDGTEYDGKAFSGLPAFVTATPTTGTLGGIARNSTDQSGRNWWANMYYSIASLPATSTNVRAMTRSLNRLKVACSDGPDQPDMILFDNNYYINFLEEIQEKTMLTDMKRGGVGFTNIVYMPLGDAPIIQDPQAPANTGYMLNTEYMYQRKAKGRWMTNLKPARPVNQDVSAETIIGYGNLTIANLNRQGLLAN